MYVDEKIRELEVKKRQLARLKQHWASAVPRLRHIVACVGQDCEDCKQVRKLLEGLLDDVERTINQV